METYGIQVKCTNCHYGNIAGEILNIPSGNFVSSFLMATPCPHCGCESLEQDKRQYKEKLNGKAKV